MGMPTDDRAGRLRHATRVMRTRSSRPGDGSIVGGEMVGRLDPRQRSHDSGPRPMIDKARADDHRMGDHAMRPPAMTTRRWMGVLALVALPMALGVTAYRVENDPGT